MNIDYNNLDIAYDYDYISDLQVSSSSQVVKPLNEEEEKKIQEQIKKNKDKKEQRASRKRLTKLERTTPSVAQQERAGNKLALKVFACVFGAALVLSAYIFMDHTANALESSINNAIIQQDQLKTELEEKKSKLDEMSSEDKVIKAAEDHGMIQKGNSQVQNVDSAKQNQVVVSVTE